VLKYLVSQMLGKMTWWRRTDTFSYTPLCKKMLLWVLLNCTWKGHKKSGKVYFNEVTNNIQCQLRASNQFGCEFAPALCKNLRFYDIRNQWQFNCYIVYRILWYIKVKGKGEGKLFTFGLDCYFCPGSPKNQHFDCPIKTNEQAVVTF
jgi:hypothetical protein